MAKRVHSRELNTLNQLPPQNSRRHSLQFEKEHNEKKWSRTSFISDQGSAAAKRRTFNAPVDTQPSTAEAKANSRFSIGSVTSLQTVNTFYTASSSTGSWHTALSTLDENERPSQTSVLRRTFRKLLQLNSVPSLIEEDEEAYDAYEYDWCGRGMHVDFAPGEKVPLKVIDSVGHGSTSSVDIVKCRRIKLARKLTLLTPRTDQKTLLKEVQALQKLRHAHVVQLIGTYRQGRKFAALLYPVADMDLAVYLEEARFMPDAKGDWTGTTNHERAHQDVLSKGSLCLISALRYVHESGIKHMDIKPANILLKRYEPQEAYSYNIAYKLYLCDFGLAQVNCADESQTETYPGKTPMYASPEVAAYNIHGRASDVFSLGCGLMEMATVYSGLTVKSLKLQFPGSYRENLGSVWSWIYTLEDMKVSRNCILEMLQEHPENRPGLVKTQGARKTIDLECLHHHDPPELFEADEEVNTAIPDLSTLALEGTSETPATQVSHDNFNLPTTLVNNPPRASTVGPVDTTQRNISSLAEPISTTNKRTSNASEIYTKPRFSSESFTSSESRRHSDYGLYGSATEVRIIPTLLHGGQTLDKNTGIMKMSRWCGTCESDGSHTPNCPVQVRLSRAASAASHRRK